MSSIQQNGNKCCINSNSRGERRRKGNTKRRGSGGEKRQGEEKAEGK